jgi:hypothetical protein
MTTKRADVWLRRKNGRSDSWYYRKLRLRTKDAVEARHRARLAQDGKWPPPHEAAAVVTGAAFQLPPAPAPAPPPPDPPPAPPGAADPPPPEPVQGEWTHAATGAAAEPTPEAVKVEPEVSSEQLAELLVTIELKVAEVYTARKVYEGFVAPAIAPDGRALLVDAYRSILDYGGGVALPPWVQRLLHQLVVPAVTVVVSSQAIVAGFRDAALEQKRAAEGGA